MKFRVVNPPTLSEQLDKHFRERSISFHPDGYVEPETFDDTRKGKVLGPRPKKLTKKGA